MLSKVRRGFWSRVPDISSDMVLDCWTLTILAHRGIPPYLKIRDSFPVTATDGVLHYATLGQKSA